MTDLGPLVKVKSATPLEGFVVRIAFQDGSVRDLDLESYLHGPIFEPIRDDMNVFGAMKVENGTITWDNGADIDPDVLYHGLTPAWMEQPERV
jgi:hypothetical protein